MRRTAVALVGIVLSGALAGPARAGSPVPSQLQAMHDAGLLDDATYAADRATYAAAVHARGRLHGRRRAELAGVLRNVDDVARAGRLTVTRLPGAFTTLRRNTQWWTTKPLLGWGQRVVFPGSDIVWQEYPGEGLNIQWLATFGRANGLWEGGYDDRLRRLLAETTALRSARAGGMAWESWFRFDGGRPPWVSGMTQATAAQAYARAAVRLGDPSLFQVGRDGLGVFRVAPPEGVRVATPAGAHYLIYSFAPRTRVLNAFVQAVNGLHDFSALANDPDARSLFAAGEAEARVEVPRFDTGAWSLYQLGGHESDLSYHRLLTGFLRGLCDRLGADRERAAAGATAPPAPVVGGVVATPPPPATSSDPAAAVPDPAVYCDAATRFAADLHTPPKVVLVAPERTPRAHRATAVGFTLSKVSAVTVRVARRGRLLVAWTARLGRGRHAVALRPREGGPLAISVRAVDLAGNAGGASGVVHVRP